MNEEIGEVTYTLRELGFVDLANEAEEIIAEGSRFEKVINYADPLDPESAAVLRNVRRDLALLEVRISTFLDVLKTMQMP